MKIQDSYEGHSCPDCGDPITQNAEDGDECENCGHVFHASQTLSRTENTNCLVGIKCPKCVEGTPVADDADEETE